MIPDFQTCMLPFLKQLQDGQIHSMLEIQKNLAIEFNLTEDELKEMIPSKSTTRFRSNVGWAKTYMQKAGLLTTPQRANYKITEEGLRLLGSNPTKIDMRLLWKYPSYREWQNHVNNDDAPKDTTPIANNKEQNPDIILENTYKRLRDILAQELLEKILAQTADFFEELVIKLLVAMGYGGSFNEAAGMVVGKTGDEGIDGIIKEDKLGLDNIYIQAKRWDNGCVGRPEIQKFVGALAGKGANKGIFITTSYFSKEARDFRPQNNIKIVLIDGKQLCQYMIDYNIGVSVSQTFEIKRIDNDFFESEE